MVSGRRLGGGDLVVGTPQRQRRYRITVCKLWGSGVHTHSTETRTLHVYGEYKTATDLAETIKTLLERYHKRGILTKLFGR